jgi:signal transduction histidine kinase
MVDVRFCPHSERWRGLIWSGSREVAVADGLERGAARLRPVSAAVLALFLVASVGGFFALRGVVDDQEHRLLSERAREAQALLDGSLSSLPATLGGMIAVAAVAPTPAAFDGIAGKQLRPKPGAPGFVYVELLKVGAAPTVVARVGEAPDAVGATVTDPVRLEAIQASAREGKLTATPLYSEGGERRLGLAMAGGGYAVYSASAVTPNASSDGPNQPFHELTAVLYATPTAIPSQIILATTKHLPLTGHTAKVTVGKSIAGADLQWLLVTQARGVLAGTAAHAVPWVVLGFGLILGLVGTAMVEVLVRRRRYAMALVRERTAELRSSLQELEQTQMELVAKERLAGIGQLASAVGHELRNPLGVLTNVLFLLRTKLSRGGPPSDDVTRQLDTADREVTAASLIVSDLLEFARAREPVREPVDLPALVDEALSVAPPPTQIAVVRRPVDGLPALSADRDQLRQVILNLLTNAYQAIGETGTVTLGIEQSDGAVQLLVADDGAGMTEETRARLFEPFFTTKAKGVGLGLAVSRRIVEAHGGRLLCESAVGSGTQFRVVLPMLTGPRQPQLPAADANTGEARSSRAGGDGA